MGKQLAQTINSPDVNLDQDQTLTILTELLVEIALKDYQLHSEVNND